MRRSGRNMDARLRITWVLTTQYFGILTECEIIHKAAYKFTQQPPNIMDAKCFSMVGRSGLVFIAAVRFMS